MDKKTYIKFAEGCIKNLDEIIERYKMISDMFLPEVVEDCFEVSEEMPTELIIESNKKMIGDSIIHLENFKKLIQDQIKVLNDYYSNLIPTDYELTMQSVEQGRIAAVQGIENLERQAEPLKKKLISTIKLADGEDFSKENSEYKIIDEIENNNGRHYVN